MKTEKIIGIMSDFLDSIRAYEHESGEAIYFDERESSEFVDMYFNNAKQEGIELTEKLINIIMKKYRLKQWYPSLPKNNKNKETLKEGSIVEIYKDDSNYFYFQFFDRCLNKLGFHYLSEEEISSDFWELIEEKPKPLFITDDGVEVFDQEDVYYVTDKLEKINSFINWFTIESMAKDTKIFKHESSADEYIWKNKPVFSYEDFIRWGNVPYDRVIMKLAKERTSKK